MKNSHHEDLQRLEANLEETHYEDLFKSLNSKSQDIAQLHQELHSAYHHLGRNAQLIDKQLVFAVFIDKLKITEYGSVQYIKAHEYKQKHASQTRRGNEENHNSNRSPSDGQHTKRDGSNHEKVRKRVPAALG